MARFRMVDINFWRNPLIQEMSKEEKDLYLYFFTNYNTTQIGIYTINKKQVAYDRGDTLENVSALMERLIEHYKVIRYNPETFEIALKYWGVVNLVKSGKPMSDCIFKEFPNVKDLSLIPYVAEMIPSREIRNIFESVYKKETTKAADKSNIPTNAEQQPLESDDTLPRRLTIRGQEIEKEEEKENHHSLLKKIESDSNRKHLQNDQKHVKEIVEFWDTNGFGLSNINAKQQLLAWLDDSPFLQPKDVIIKAMTIACAYNKRQLNYVTTIMKNWKNQSLLTLEEINAYQGNHKPAPKEKNRAEAPAGRYIPKIVDVDMTEGEAS